MSYRRLYLVADVSTDRLIEWDPRVDKSCLYLFPVHSTMPLQIGKWVSDALMSQISQWTHTMIMESDLPQLWGTCRGGLVGRPRRTTPELSIENLSAWSFTKTLFLSLNAQWGSRRCTWSSAYRTCRVLPHVFLNILTLKIKVCFSVSRLEDPKKAGKVLIGVSFLAKEGRRSLFPELFFRLKQRTTDQRVSCYG